jgi:hypothetical protein
MVKDSLAATVREELQDREVSGLSYGLFRFHRPFLDVLELALAAE